MPAVKKLSIKVRIPWSDLSSVLGLEYTGPDAEILSDMAGTQTRAWVEEYERQNEALSEEDVDELRQAFLENLEQHWSLRSVITNKVDIDKLVDHINSWSNRGMHSAIYHRTLKGGDGILDWETEEDGLVFTLAPPFLIAIIESNYCISSEDDSGLLFKDVVAADLLGTIRDIYACEGLEPMTVDLSGWDDYRVVLDDEEIMKRMRSGKRRRSKRRSVADFPC